MDRKAAIGHLQRLIVEESEYFHTYGAKCRRETGEKEIQVLSRKAEHLEKMVQNQKAQLEIISEHPDLKSCSTGLNVCDDTCDCGDLPRYAIF